MLWLSRLTKNTTPSRRLVLFVPRETVPPLPELMGDSLLVPTSPEMLNMESSAMSVTIRSSINARFSTEMELGMSRRSCAVREPDRVCVAR